MICLERRHFTDSVCKAQVSKKLGSKRFGPFLVVELIDKNAVCVDLPSHIRAHDVVHVDHTKLFREQPGEIANAKPVPAFDAQGHPFVEIGAVLAHRRRGKGFQFLASPKNAPTHDAE